MQSPDQAVFGDFIDRWGVKIGGIFTLAAPQTVQMTDIVQNLIL